jgi:peptide chain release factor 2
MMKPDFWNDPASKDLIKKRSIISGQLAIMDSLAGKAEEASLLIEMGEEEDDEATLLEAAAEIGELDREVARAEFTRLLSGRHDSNNAILTVHAGAGGTEAQDWAEMLLRMYQRWCEAKGFKITTLDFMPGDEAGIKGVTLLVDGPFAYGYLKAEAGVHRLVRISPFDASGRRHTSFASVFLAPAQNEQITVDIDEKDLRIDTYRASGAGGQHVNKTDSAIRITHLPTGIVVQCQNERSQHKNRAIAMKILQARLYELEEEKLNSEKQKLHEEKKDIAWGSQIRSYVMHPYQMVKDHRTGEETGNVNDVMDGNIDRFIQAWLSKNADMNG